MNKHESHNSSSRESRRASYREVLPYLRPHRRLFIAALLCMILFGATDGALPFLIKHILDGVFAERDEQLLLLMPVVVVSFAIFRAVVDYGQQFLMARVGHLVVRDVRNRLNQHLLQLPPSYFTRQSSGDLVARVTGDVLLVRTLLTDSLASIIRDSIRLTALLSAALYLDWMLALAASVVFPVALLPLARISKRLRKLSKRGQAETGALSGLFQESIVGNRVVKLFGKEGFEQARFQTRNAELTTTFLKSERARALTGPINEVLASIAIAAVMVYGGYSVIAAERTQGDFIAFLIAVFLMYDPFKKLSRVHAVMQQGLAGFDRVQEVLEAPIEVAAPRKPQPLPVSGTLEFINVGFTYRGADRPALSGINLTVREGERLALVGFSGAGKSTFVDLIPRFIDPTEGVVQLGGVDLRDLDLAELRSGLSVVGQHTFLFNDTVRNNIAYGSEGCSDERVREVARAAYALEFIEQLPQGFDTQIGEGGATLSGGERQRIAIARALLKDAPLLILDEATSALDNRAEREVQRALEELMQGRTCIIIAHRLSTVQHSDRIAVFEEGRIVELGPHDDLVKRGGVYATLHTFVPGKEVDAAAR